MFARTLSRSLFVRRSASVVAPAAAAFAAPSHRLPAAQVQHQQARHITLDTMLQPKSMLKASTQGTMGTQQGEYLRRLVLQQPSNPTAPSLSIEIVHGDLAMERSDVIVNPSNPELMNAAHLNDLTWHLLRAGGAELKERTDAWLRDHGSSGRTAVLSIGTVVSLPASGMLQSRYVMHAIAPSWRSLTTVSVGSTADTNLENGQMDAKAQQQLRSTVLSIINEAEQNLHAQSISIPALSTLLNAGSRSRVARIFFDTIINDYFLKRGSDSQSSLRTIRLVNDDPLTVQCFISIFDDEIAYLQSEDSHAKEYIAHVEERGDVANAACGDSSFANDVYR